jgi:hypothetical protein
MKGLQVKEHAFVLPIPLFQSLVNRPDPLAECKIRDTAFAFGSDFASLSMR